MSGKGAHNIKDFPTLYNPFQLGDDRRLSGSRTDMNIIKVTTAHRRVIALHMSGWSNMNIATAMNRHPSWVSNVLGDPMIQGIIKRLLSETDDQLAALFPLAVNTLKDVMEKGSDGARVNAATTILKSQGKIKDGEGKQATAEDVIARIMASIQVEGKAVISIGTLGARQQIEQGSDPIIDVTPIPARQEAGSIEEED